MDNATFERLVLENESKLYRVSMSMLKNESDAQDAVHDAILTAFEKNAALKKEDAFSSWLMSILVRCCYRRLRQRKALAKFGEPLPEASSRDNPYLSIELGKAINSLPPKHRAVVLLYYIEDYSVKEIKEILKIPEGTIKSRLNKGRSLLRDFLRFSDDT